MFIKIGFILILTTKNSVLFHGSNSSIKSNSIGMPEGSILGSLLFLVYNNDLCKCVKYSGSDHFAVRTNMLQSHSSLETLVK